MAGVVAEGVAVLEGDAGEALGQGPLDKISCLQTQEKETQKEKRQTYKEELTIKRKKSKTIKTKKTNYTTRR